MVDNDKIMFQEFVDNFRSDAMLDISQRESDNDLGIYIKECSECGDRFTIGFRNIGSLIDKMDRGSRSYFIRIKTYSFRPIDDECSVVSDLACDYRLVTKDILDSQEMIIASVNLENKCLIDISLIERDREIGMNYIICHITDKESKNIRSRCSEEYDKEGEIDDV